MAAYRGEYVIFLLEHEMDVEECAVACEALLDLGRAHRADTSPDELLNIFEMRENRSRRPRETPRRQVQRRRHPRDFVRFGSWLKAKGNRGDAQRKPGGEAGRIASIH
jgi:hypothetical protein